MPKAIVIGAGIVGLATARSLSMRGYAVTVLERNPQALGASIRNFGMIWPIGQPSGPLLERAMSSRRIWQEICTEAGIWHNPCGSIQCAYGQDELRVLEEFIDLNEDERKISLLKPDEALALSPYLRKEGLLAVMRSENEMLVDPREAIAKIPGYLRERWKVDFHFNTVATDIIDGTVRAGQQLFDADEIFVCSGADFETLYPELFQQTEITKCKLQMMRSIPFPQDIGPAICGGMTMTHYAAFEGCTSLPVLKARLLEQYPEHARFGIHVMVSQNGLGELVIGDSHEYGLAPTPFDEVAINKLILDYLQSFTSFPVLEIGQTWNGIYPKLKKGTEVVMHPEPGVTLINGLGGAGMTMSFGLAEEVIKSVLQVPQT